MKSDEGIFAIFREFDRDFGTIGIRIAKIIPQMRTWRPRNLSHADFVRFHCINAACYVFDAKTFSNNFQWIIIRNLYIKTSAKRMQFKKNLWHIDLIYMFWQLKYQFCHCNAGCVFELADLWIPIRVFLFPTSHENLFKLELL